MKDLQSKTWEARAAAYEEAAGHLAQHWTDDILEREQGMIIATNMNLEAEKLHSKAYSRELTQDLRRSLDKALGK